ncbi:DUF2924 domain-containing protein [Plastoroseomonas arctica]|nr:DUF2924 domain-containing protein [Plastoroseomonas arctica]
MLRRDWERLLGRAAPGAASSDFLQRDIAYHQQVGQHGGLSAATRGRLAALACADPAAAQKPTNATPRIKPGSTLLREWHGRTYTVLVLEAGFEMAGKHFSSLTEIAFHITGTNWSGPRFFGLLRRRATVQPRCVSGNIISA